MFNPLDILHQHWGHPQFRPQQEAIIQSVLDGCDTLALLPTGGGKSICFQVPALCQEGICLVISPLIALMKDQVQNLQKKGISALAIYAGMAYRDIDRLLDNCVHGEVKFLYLSPERLASDLAIARIKQMKVSLIAVDEAHCISQWGYDFRPPYLEIAQVREFFPQVPLIALTATATPEVVQDIQEKLAFKNQQVFQSSFARPNLAYIVRPSEAKENQLLEILQKVPGCGVVYVRNRGKTKEIAQLLQKKRISADYYHAGLSPDERSSKQDAWISGRTRIMVSTNAFGMGIDKSDVRTVIHLELPDSLEAYFQEAGRAGRDGQKSYAVLLYNQSDRRSLEYQYTQAFPSLDEARQVYRALGSYFQLALGGGQGESYDFDISNFCQSYNLELVRTFNCLKLL
jgi:ATP-dependent DNA helicase RecQ